MFGLILFDYSNVKEDRLPTDIICFPVCFVMLKILVEKFFLNFITLCHNDIIDISLCEQLIARVKSFFSIFHEHHRLYNILSRSWKDGIKI